MWGLVEVKSGSDIRRDAMSPSSLDPGLVTAGGVGPAHKDMWGLPGNFDYGMAIR